MHYGLNEPLFAIRMCGAARSGVARAELAEPSPRTRTERIAQHEAPFVQSQHERIERLQRESGERSSPMLEGMLRSYADVETHRMPCLNTRLTPRCWYRTKQKCNAPLQSFCSLLLGSFRWFLIAQCEMTGSQGPFATHHIKDIHALTIDPVEHAARRFNNLPVAPPF
jgi:hypothetical protein